MTDVMHTLTKVRHCVVVSFASLPYTLTPSTGPLTEFGKCSSDAHEATETLAFWALLGVYVVASVCQEWNLLLSYAETEPLPHILHRTRAQKRP